MRDGSILAIEIAITAALCAGSGYLGWHARSVVADRDSAEQAANDAARVIDAERSARAAADDYARRVAQLRPVVRTIRLDAAPALRVLADCPVPADVGGLLERAAAAADGAAGRDPADGAGAALVDR